MEETLDILERYLQEDHNHIVLTPNPEGVMQARRNKDVLAAFVGADLSLADGIGILLAAKFTKQKIPCRVRGVDTIFALCNRMAQKNKKLAAYFYGAKPGVAKRAKANIESMYPNVEVVGYTHGFEKDDSKVINDVNVLSPDIVLVCTGMPRAELWSTKNRNINTRVTMCLGGTLDIMAGDIKLAPSFLRKIGLEWLYRLVTQPTRAKRMLDIPRFMFAVVFGQ